jgi:hypothetical protein
MAAVRRSYVVLILMGLLAVLGCSTPPPPATDLLEPGARLLTEFDLKGSKAVLGERSSGELVVTLWKEGGKWHSASGGGRQSTRPLVDWSEGLQVVAGRFEQPGGAQVQVTTDSGKITGKLENGVYLAAWPAAKPTAGFVIHIFDAQGKELFRWAPASGPSAA